MIKHAKRTTSGPIPPIDPVKKLSALAMAKLLSSMADGPVALSTIRAHIEAGAPADGRKRMSLADYAAWLVGQVERDGSTASSPPSRQKRGH